jgi:hypothetical protein
MGMHALREILTHLNLGKDSFGLTDPEQSSSCKEAPEYSTAVSFEIQERESSP